MRRRHGRRVLARGRLSSRGRLARVALAHGRGEDALGHVADGLRDGLADEELRDLLVEREEDFSRGFTEQMIEYALGRPFSFTDEELANEILVASKDKQFAISEFIHALVQSKPFQSK